MISTISFYFISNVIIKIGYLLIAVSKEIRAWVRGQ